MRFRTLGFQPGAAAIERVAWGQWQEGAQKGCTALSVIALLPGAFDSVPAGQSKFYRLISEPGEQPTQDRHLATDLNRVIL